MARSAIDRKVHLYAMFLDFRKAFDVVDRELMYHRLNLYGISGFVLCLIKQIYSRTMNKIRLNGELSSPFESMKGVRQGDNLSPTIFNCFINDLVMTLNSCDLGVKVPNGTTIGCLAYADDIVILSENTVKMQQMLNITDKWCKNWRALINTQKSKILNFRRKNVPRTGCSFMMGNIPLDTVETYKYLGVMLNEHLDLDAAVAFTASEASRALGHMIGKT